MEFLEILCARCRAERDSTAASLRPTEHAVLRHALVVRAPDHGVDQRLRDADESAAASQLLRPAAPLGRSPGPLAEAGARLVQQRSSAPVSGRRSLPFRTRKRARVDARLAVTCRLLTLPPQVVGEHHLAAGRAGATQPVSVQGGRTLQRGAALRRLARQVLREYFTVPLLFGRGSRSTFTPSVNRDVQV